MSLLAYGLKLVGGNWGTLLQVTFRCATLLLAVVVLVLVLVSDRFRAWLRVTIARNFYRYQYDYRSEWLRFIARVLAPADAWGLPERVVQAVAAVLEARVGWLMVPDDDLLQAIATLQMADCQPDPLSLDDGLAALVRAQERVLDLEVAREAADRMAVRRALTRADGNISLAAKLLGVRRPTLCDLMKQYGLGNAA